MNTRTNSNALAGTNLERNVFENFRAILQNVA